MKVELKDKDKDKKHLVAFSLDNPEQINKAACFFLERSAQFDRNDITDLMSSLIACGSPLITDVVRRVPLYFDIYKDYSDLLGKNPKEQGRTYAAISEGLY